MRRPDSISTSLVQLTKQAWLQHQTEAALSPARILEEGRYEDSLRLECFGFKVYSQNDEDGIVGNGLENNSLFLLEQDSSGAWMEGSESHVSAIERGFRRQINAGRLRVFNAFIRREDINELIRKCSLPRELDCLSIDLDGNDYHIWAAIAVTDPRVVTIEYNAKFRPPMQWVMGYDPTHRWDGSDQFGASLASLVELRQGKGYCLVGCNITGANAFFVKSELAEKRFAEESEAASLYQPARYFLTAAFVSGRRPRYSQRLEPTGTVNCARDIIYAGDDPACMMR